MYNASEEAMNLFQKLYRQVIRITFRGTYDSFVVYEDEIIQGGLTIDRYSVSGSKIEIGSAIAAELNLKLKNYDGKYDNTIFEGGELFVEIGIKKWDAHRWENAEIIYIPMGYFIIDDPPRALSTISISALDRMVLFDKDVNWDNFSFPMTVAELIEKVCDICDVTCNTDLTTLTNYDYSITATPSGTSITYRNLIQWAAFITATCAFINYDGELVFQWYEQTGVSITPSERYSSDIYENDVTLTGITYTGTDGAAYLAGDTEYTISGSGNYLLQDDIDTAITNIYYAIRGFSYRPYEATVKPVPYLYPMDMILYTDSKGEVHETIVTHITFTINNSTSIAGTGETSTSSSYSSSSGLTSEQTQAIEEAMNSVQITISSQELSGLYICQLLANAMGFHLTVSSSDTTNTYYIHDKNTLANSTIIYSLQNGTFVFTEDWNNGNPVWTGTLDSEHNIILEILADYKLSGDNIAEQAITEAHLSDIYLEALSKQISTAQSSAVASAKSYTDEQLDDAKEYIDTGDSDTLTAAKNYSDTNLQSAKSYSDTNLQSAKSYSDTNLQSAKSYSDTNLTTAKEYADKNLDTAKEYADKNLDTAKGYSDTNLTTAKNYSDSNLTAAKQYTDDGLDDAKEYIDGIEATLKAMFNSYMLSTDIQQLARKIFITDEEGTEYAGVLKVVNGKPVFEYDTTEGGNEDG